jgi:hypothetical protein
MNEFIQLICNPFTFGSGAILSFKLREQTEVLLKILDSGEKVVRVLLNENLPAGQYDIQFNAGALPEGNYTARIHMSTSMEVTILNASIPIKKSSSQSVGDGSMC